MTITLTVKLIHESHIVGNVTTLSLKFLNAVLEWSAKRVDRIILLFDPHISDEFRRSIEALRGHDDKIRIVVNKTDMIDPQQLIRVNGALMWSLGKVLNTREGARVYIRSF